MDSSEAELQEVAIFDDVDEGICALRTLLPGIHNPTTRKQLIDLIRKLEAGEVTAAVFVVTFGDGLLKPVLIGGNLEERLNMAEGLRAQLRLMREATLH